MPSVFIPKPLLFMRHKQLLLPLRIAWNSKLISLHLFDNLASKSNFHIFVSSPVFKALLCVKKFFILIAPVI